MSIRHPLSIAFLTLASSVPAPCVFAAPQAYPQPGRVATADPESREARRIFHLSNGQTIRVVSRRVGDVWEYKSKEAWKSFEASAVARVATEADVLRQFRSLDAACNRRNMPCSVELVRWALDAGLATEALSVADAILAIEPDQAQLLAILERCSGVTVPSLAVAPAELDNARAELLRFGAAVPPAVRELAVRELKRSGTTEDLRRTLARELSSSVTSRRSFAALALRRLYPGAEVKPLVMHAVLDPSAEVRQSASLALRAVDEPGVIVPVVRVLSESESPSLRANAAEALGHMHYAAAVEPLMNRLITASTAQSGGGSRIPHSTIFVGRQVAYVQDFDVEIAQASAIADPQINVLVEGASLEAAVQGVQQVSVSVEVATIRTALLRITGARPGESSKAWIEWWRENADSWRSADHSDPAKRALPRTGKG